MAILDQSAEQEGFVTERSKFTKSKQVSINRSTTHAKEVELEKSIGTGSIEVSRLVLNRNSEGTVLPLIQNTDL